MLQLNQVESW